MTKQQAKIQALLWVANTIRCDPLEDLADNPKDEAKVKAALYAIKDDFYRRVSALERRERTVAAKQSASR